MYLITQNMERVSQNNLTGFLLVDKPVDWTSHDVIGYIRGFLRQNNLTDAKRPKVGHAGTLDPFATGLLIVGIGREATRRIDEFKNMPKEYIATIRLGATSNTMDRTGAITTYNSSNIPQVSEKNVREVLESFVGKQKQIPPMYSAKKVGGKKLYELARKGIEIERQPNEIEVYDIELVKALPLLGGVGGGSSQKEKSSINHEPLPNPPLKRDRDFIYSFTLRISCSTGTYIRTLAHDIGQALGTGAYCEELRRTRIDSYSVHNAVIPHELTFTYIDTHLFNKNG